MRAPLSEDEHSLAYILENGAITPYFQPIYDFITGDVVGHESLSRGPEGSALFFRISCFKRQLPAVSSIPSSFCVVKKRYTVLLN